MTGRRCLLLLIVLSCYFFSEEIIFSAEERGLYMKRKNFPKKHLANRKGRIADNRCLSGFLTDCFRSFRNKKYIYASVIFALSACPAYADTTETDTLTNNLISTNRAGVAGDLKTYNYPDRNLVIIWNNDKREDGCAIRNADVTAKNININADFPFDSPRTYSAHKWTSKGVISEDNLSTHINASGDITIKTYDDSVYTQGNGKTYIN